ncbi:glycosyltransferase family 22 protein [Tilletiaria anomala UBC 951]|uniref:Mannosyltransferase n=1 Tax=Tilletiaria anomala (strain ATCC 24038 / CBS 436.72 / UBC 951) TaxID=1037660 RepID=A0A066VGN5_TILAU|nr:glycosyltransferase family 22 protein [Tilletiaria anomala UBC 951]KDN40872.1 glycosyltransferase family 22 protein [Tilletiaria anomala UBC 951]
MPNIWDGLTLAVFVGATVAHILYTPYTKIEEHFVLNAVHDNLAWGLLDGEQVRKHFEFFVFPDPVPHSFLGVQALSIAVYPFAVLGRWSGLIRSSADVQITVRLVLGLLNAAAVFYFSEVVRQLGESPEDEPKRLSKGTSESPRRQDGSFARNLFLLLHGLQFNFLFWAGRTTHNSLVLGPTLVALRWILISNKPWQGSSPSAVAGFTLLTFCTAILRCELVGVLAPSCLWLIATNRAKFGDLFHAGLISAVISVGLTTWFDKPLWSGIHNSSSLPYVPYSVNQLISANFIPEFEAFSFNILQGKSAAWGTMSRTFYFTSALPKALSISIVLVPIGMALMFRLWSSYEDYVAVKKLESVTGLLVIPLFHTCLLSLVSHKEWRFIIYTVPCFNAFSALALGQIWGSTFATSAFSAWIMRLGTLAVLCGTALHASIATLASHYNYPGGMAMARLHDALDGKIETNVLVHSTVDATMSGSTRFQLKYLQRPTAGALGVPSLPSAFPFTSSASAGVAWEYDRREDLSSSNATQWLGFTHVIDATPNCSFLASDTKAGPHLFHALLPPVQALSQVEFKYPQLHSDPRELVKVTLADRMWICERA